MRNYRQSAVLNFELDRIDLGAPVVECMIDVLKSRGYTKSLVRLVKNLPRGKYVKLKHLDKLVWRMNSKDIWRKCVSLSKAEGGCDWY